MDRDSVTVARKIFEGFEAHSVGSFFSKNKEMLGYTGKVRNLTTLIHEGVTNAIDAAEEAGVLPSVHVAIEELDEEPGLYTVVIEDNASGIPEEYVPRVFGKLLAGTKMHRNVQSRGQQGIGISGGLLFAQATTGQPAEVVTSTGEDEDILECGVVIDVGKNRGEVNSKEWTEGDWVGTRVEFKVKDVTYRESRYGPLNYLRMTAIANPHVQIIFEGPGGGSVDFKRAVEDVPERPEPILPHPNGVDVDGLLELAKSSSRRKISTFLVKELSRFSRGRLEELEKKIDVTLEKDPGRLTWSEAEEIVSAFDHMDFMVPSSCGLKPIGEENIREGLEQILDPDFADAVTRPPEVYKGGVPFIVEVGVAYGAGAGSNSGSEGGLEVLRFGNRAPLIFNQGGCALTKAVEDVNWRRYGVNVGKDPISVLVDLVSTHVPYTSTGKQSVAKREVVFEEVKQGTMQVARKLRSFLQRKKKRREKKQRKNLFKKYLPIVSQKAADALGRENPPDISPLVEKITGGSEEDD